MRMCALSANNSRAESVGGMSATQTKPLTAHRDACRKRSAGDLAILGGSPAFTETQLVGRPNLPPFEDFTELMREAFERRWLTNRGPLVQQFEDQVAQISDAKHCIAVANATLGLQLVAHAAGIAEEVILPAFTFIATAHAFRWQNATPVFADALTSTHQIDPAHVQSLIGPRTQGLVGVHLWGETCDINRLEALANRHGLALIFDAAHAFACSHQSRPVGSHGLAEVFSFHATKFINTFEGGAICTNDDALAWKLRSTVNFGFGDGDTAICLGMNAKMNEASAAMGLANLRLIDQVIAHNRLNFETYQSILGNHPALRMYPFNLAERRNFQYVVFEVTADVDHLTRDELIKALAVENIIARRYFSPGLHNHEPYASNSAGSQEPLIGTDELSRRVFLLPTGTTVSSEDASIMAEVVRMILDNADLVRHQIRSASPQSAE